MCSIVKATFITPIVMSPIESIPVLFSRMIAGGRLGVSRSVRIMDGYIAKIVTHNFKLTYGQEC